MSSPPEPAVDENVRAIVHERTTLRRGRILDIGIEDVTLPSGIRATLDVLRHPGASCVLPLVDDGVILIRQFRHCADGWLWEAPAGTLNAGEDPETCAHRELAEEAGLAGTLQHVGAILTAPGFTDERIHLWLAKDTSSTPMNRDVDEVITEVRHFSWSAVLAMVRAGEITDAKTLAVLFQAQLRR